MPHYTNFCSACQHEFVEYQSIKDKPLKKCPSCGKYTLERLIRIAPEIAIKDKEPKTVGDLAQRNSDKMSRQHFADLERNSNINAYKRKPNLEKPDKVKKARKAR